MLKRFKVVFVLGGPGSGKGTQSAFIEQAFKFKHLSAGQLLRQQQARDGSQFGHIIQTVILQGKIVPSHITIQLLTNAMTNYSKSHKYFLIDGYPRNLQNLNSWRSMTQDIAECPFVLHFKCSEQEMMKRLLKRSQISNRSDDNVQVIRKRFLTYNTQTQDVLRQFQKYATVHHINGDPSPPQIFDQVKPFFQDFLRVNSIT